MSGLYRCPACGSTTMVHCPFRGQEVPVWRWVRFALAALALPVAGFAVVILRGVPLAEFWQAYWEIEGEEEH